MGVICRVEEGRDPKRFGNNNKFQCHAEEIEYTTDQA